MLFYCYVWACRRRSRRLVGSVTKICRALSGTPYLPACGFLAGALVVVVYGSVVCATSWCGWQTRGSLVALGGPVRGEGVPP